MTLAARRRSANRAIYLDRSLEALPIFRLSDSAEESTITYSPATGGRWRVLPSPGDRLPGTFDQDVYVEILHRYADEGFPTDGIVTFTLHSVLRSIGRRVDGLAKYDFDRRRNGNIASAAGRSDATHCRRRGVCWRRSVEQDIDPVVARAGSRRGEATSAIDVDAAVDRDLQSSARQRRGEA